MRIGKLRHRVTIQTYSETPDATHGIDSVYTDVATVWADLKPLAGTKYFAGKQNSFEDTHLITIRYRSDITSENWILFNGRRFRIRKVSDLGERKRFLMLHCEEAFQEAAYGP